MGEAKRKRQAPCHCGSGLAYEKCCLEGDRKPRYRGFVFTPAQDVVIDGLQYTNDGRIELLSGDNPIALTDVRPTEWRETANGLKIKSQALGSDIAYIGPEAALATSDYIFGVDTNTTTFGDRQLHVTCLTCATTAIPSEGYDGTIQQIMCVDFDDEGFPPERIGWLLALDAISRSLPPGDAKVALFTDHDLNALPAINSRQVPLLVDRYLPNGFSLNYATDKGSALTNKVMKAAHKGATKVAKSIRKDGVHSQLVLPYLLNGSADQRIRHWRNEHSSLHFY